MDLSKYIKSEVAELNRSAIHLASYNPRVIKDEEKKALKRIIKKYGLVGGIVVNKQTGFTVVSGHQRISVMDELQKYDSKTKAKDYKLRVDVIDVDPKTEKELNIAMNNPNAQGEWDRDKLAEIIPGIDYKDCGLTEADLSLIGLDYMFQTKEEEGLADSLTNMMGEVEQEHKKDLESKQAERAEKVAHMKEVKQQVKELAQKNAGDMDAYVMLSFDNMKNKTTFLRRFGFPEDSKYIKGEDMDSRCELSEEI